jgi:hypothetical protein
MIWYQAAKVQEMNNFFSLVFIKRGYEIYKFHLSFCFENSHIFI